MKKRSNRPDFIVIDDMEPGRKKIRFDDLMDMKKNLDNQNLQFAKTAFDNAVEARLSYEVNCAQKYDRHNLPSLSPKPGDTMEAFAMRFDTKVEYMMLDSVVAKVEKILEEPKRSDYE